jgi:hypothetical protein
VEMKQYGFYSSGGHDKQLKFIQQYYKDNKWKHRNALD